jgi:hypothetical protein
MPAGDAAGLLFSLSGYSLTSASVVRSKDAMEAAFWSAVRVTLGGVDYTCLDQIAETFGLRVEAVVRIRIALHFLHHNGAFVTGVGDLVFSCKETCRANIATSFGCRLRSAITGNPT